MWCSCNLEGVSREQAGFVIYLPKTVNDFTLVPKLKSLEMSSTLENCSSDTRSKSREDEESPETDASSLYESQDYLPPHNQVYLAWLQRQPPRLRAWDKWLMFGLIGLTTG